MNDSGLDGRMLLLGLGILGKDPSLANATDDCGVAPFVGKHMFIAKIEEQTATIKALSGDIEQLHAQEQAWATEKQTMFAEKGAYIVS